MVSNYQLLEKLEKLPYFNSLLKQGIIPINWIDYKVIFEFYVEEVKAISKKGFSKATSERQAKDKRKKIQLRNLE